MKEMGFVCYSLPVTDIQRLILGRFLQNLAFAAPIQTLFFQARGLSLGQVLILQSVLLAAGLLLEVPTGIVGDRFGKKWSIVCGLLCSLLAWIPWFLASGVWTFAIAFVLLGASQAFISGSDQALLYEILSSQGRKQKMQKIYGIYLAMSTLGYAMAGLIGGFMATHQSLTEYIRLYELTAGAQLIALFFFLSIREPVATKKLPTVNTRNIFRTSFKLIATNKKLRRIILLSVLTTPFSVALLSLYQPYFVHASVPAVWFGIALFLSSLAASATKLFAHRLESALGVGRATLLTTVLPGLLWLAMAFLFQPVFAVLLFIFSDAAGNLRDPIFADYLNRHIPSTIRATTLSAVSMMTSLYLLVMQPVIGLFADQNLHYAFVFMGCFIVVGSLIFRIGSEHIKVED